MDKSLLSQLRKETGFGFAKCMESLQLFNNDYNEAITWLKAEAEKQGWEKATKLQGRTASEGLVGVLVDGNFGAMVEVSYIKVPVDKAAPLPQWIKFPGEDSHIKGMELLVVLPRGKLWILVTLGVSRTECQYFKLSRSIVILCWRSRQIRHEKCYL